MVKMISINCPGCGAKLEIEEDRSSAFCTYCGNKIALSNENEHIIRTIDEAKVIKAKSDAELKMKKLEISEKKRKIRWIITLISGSIALILTIMTCIGFMKHNNLMFTMFPALLFGFIALAPHMDEFNGK